MASTLDDLVNQLHVPGLRLLNEEESAVASALVKQLDNHFKQVKDEGGRIYGDWLPDFHHVSVRLVRKSDHARPILERSILYRIAGAMKDLLELVEVYVDITYATATSPIHGTTIRPRSIETVEFQTLFEDRFKHFSGEVEAVHFTGYYKTRRDSLMYRGTKIVEAESTYSGLYLPITLAIYGGTDATERCEDRLRRMKHRCCRGETLSVCRNLNGLLNPTRLCQQFREDPGQFEKVRRHEELYERAMKLRKSLRDEIKKCAAKEKFLDLMTVALRVVPDDDFGEYVSKHLGLHRQTRETIENVVEKGKSIVRDTGMAILQKLKKENCEEVLPAKLAELFISVVDCTFESDHATWRLDFVAGKDTMALDGDEEVLMIQLKHCNLYKLLENIGMKVSSEDFDKGLISWENEERLAPGQRKIKQLAAKMCFKSIVPDEVQKGTKGMLDATINLHGVSPRSREQYAEAMIGCHCRGKGCEVCCVPLKEFLKKSHSLPMCEPSISPSSASGALGFVTPVVARDLPKMMDEARLLGKRIGVGTLFISKHWEQEVMSVLNPTQDIYVVGRFIRAKTAFEKSRTTIELPNAPGGHFRHQGLAWAKSQKSQLKKDTELPTERGLRLSREEIVSASTRLTCTTGDLPREKTTSRPNECDRSHRQQLRGHLRADVLHSHRSSGTSTAEFTQDPTQLYITPDEDLEDFHSEVPSVYSVAAGTANSGYGMRQDQQFSKRGNGVVTTQRDARRQRERTRQQRLEMDES
eukprot:CAMPEP_0169310974 /NCGR_PEP_ID=MMETSP1017-20121227/3255_1 /TAXON_ID=342587 /ORGANISM="Karlodinium micrum, Strain CCMP2283" /LENGTH=754 /DNA_ID=CAMNT_0009404651 /DNA_START=29 /DNA_END=2293 /DNA_ORIENTATION=-